MLDALVPCSSEDCKKLDCASSPEGNKASTSCRNNGSDEQACSRKAGRCSGANSRASSSTVTNLLPALRRHAQLALLIS